MEVSSMYVEVCLPFRAVPEEKWCICTILCRELCAAIRFAKARLKSWLLKGNREKERCNKELKTRYPDPQRGLWATFAIEPLRLIYHKKRGTIYTTFHGGTLRWATPCLNHASWRQFSNSFFRELRTLGAL